MKYANIFRIAGGALIVLIGLLQGAGGLQLLKGGPAAWPDIRADEIVVRRSAYALIIFAVLSLITGGAVMNGVPWSDLGAAITLIIFVALSFWGNYLLFGGIRLLHTGTNIIVASIILTLLWLGSPR
jgi:hypothetical protein